VQEQPALALAEASIKSSVQMHNKEHNASRIGIKKGTYIQKQGACTAARAR
jgi:hypothetical protein